VSDIRHRLYAALTARPGRAQIAGAILCGLLAFAMVTQAHTTAAGGGLSTARPEDLVAILADLSSRADRLRTQVQDLQQTEGLLSNGSTRDSAALQQARLRAQTLGILTGTLAARGPGVVLTIVDPQRSVDSATVLDAVEELRDAGAEAIQLSGVRIVASSSFKDQGGRIEVDGQVVSAPIRIAAIGDPRTLATALAIAGGIVDTVNAQPGAHAIVVQSPQVSVTALRALRVPRYASPSPAPS